MKLVQQMPSFRQGVEITISRGSQNEVIRYNYEGGVPQEIMDAYQQVLGDASARVSVSADFAVKDFGTGTGTMVSVSLSCNQDQQTLLQAINLAGDMARWAAKQEFTKAEVELKQLLPMKAQQGSPNFG